ncbi:unnamed protein product [Adineta ricciae]|uniref:Uncharacterized protein n=1 Tax=Adineta ricciae TaxID=249248 RepID=A0A814NPX1_ADIRI|nr:unnamed protein product [Adineta ricciae]
MHIHSTFAIFLLFCLLIQTLYGIPSTHYRAEQDDQQLASLIDELKERQWHIDSSAANDDNSEEEQLNKRSAYSKFRLSPLWLSRRTRGNRFYGKPLWISRHG